MCASPLSPGQAGQEKREDHLQGQLGVLGVGQAVLRQQHWIT